MPPNVLKSSIRFGDLLTCLVFRVLYGIQVLGCTHSQENPDHYRPCKYSSWTVIYPQQNLSPNPNLNPILNPVLDLVTEREPNPDPNHLRTCSVWIIT